MDSSNCEFKHENQLRDEHKVIFERLKQLNRDEDANYERLLIFSISCYIVNTVRERLFGEYWPWNWIPGLTFEEIVNKLKPVFIDGSASLDRKLLGLIVDPNSDLPASEQLLQKRFLSVWNLFSPHVDFLQLSKLMSDEIGEEEHPEEYALLNPPFFIRALSSCQEEFAKGSAHWNLAVFSSPFKTVLELNSQYKAEDLQQLVIAFFVLLKDLPLKP